MELDEYAREGIDGSRISYKDNLPVLDMLLAKPIGLLAICDEEALFPKVCVLPASAVAVDFPLNAHRSLPTMPQGTDRSMIEKLHQNLEKREGYSRPRGDAVQFSVAHYAGKVTYEGAGFLEKHRDALPMDIVACMRLSGNELLGELFGASGEDRKERDKKFKLSGKVRPSCPPFFLFFFGRAVSCVRGEAFLLTRPACAPPPCCDEPPFAGRAQTCARQRRRSASR